jgi:hypothetical protein
MELNYFGVNITGSGNLLKEIKTQAQEEARAFGCLNDLVWRKIYEEENKIKKNTRQPHSRLVTYALETREETSKTRDTLEANNKKVRKNSWQNENR